jgi:hypothetical protein
MNKTKKIYNVSYLKQFIIDIDFIPLNIKIPTVRPIKYPHKVEGLYILSKLYGIKLKIQIKKRQSNLYSSYLNRCITLAIEPKGMALCCDLCKDFSHELAHHIQLTYSNENSYYYKDTKHALKFEYTAERLAYFIYKKYFSNIKELKHRQFNTYRTKADIEWLKEYLKK